MLRFSAVFITGLSYLNKPPSLFFLSGVSYKKLVLGKKFCEGLFSQPFDCCKILE